MIPIQAQLSSGVQSCTAFCTYNRFFGYGLLVPIPRLCTCIITWKDTTGIDPLQLLHPTNDIATINYFCRCRRVNFEVHRIVPSRFLAPACERLTSRDFLFSLPLGSRTQLPSTYLNLYDTHSASKSCIRLRDGFLYSPTIDFDPTNCSQNVSLRNSPVIRLYPFLMWNYNHGSAPKPSKVYLSSNHQSRFWYSRLTPI